MDTVYDANDEMVHFSGITMPSSGDGDAMDWSRGYNESDNKGVDMEEAMEWAN